jgi:hypothetical protein
MCLITQPIITWLGHDAHADTMPLKAGDGSVVVANKAKIQKADLSLNQPAMMTHSRQARRLPIKAPVPQTSPSISERVLLGKLSDPQGGEQLLVWTAP